MHNIGDPTLSIQAQATAILALLSERAPEFATNKQATKYDVEFRTYSWYNGRERGISIVMHLPSLAPHVHVVTFGEERGSDQIFVDSWGMPFKCYGDPPELKDFSEKVYKQRKNFRMGQCGQAAEFIYNQFAKAYKTLKKGATRG